MFAFQRADSIRPALNSSVDRHSTDQEDTETVTQVIWHQNGQKAQVEAAWTDGLHRGRVGDNLSLHFTPELALSGN